MKKQPTGTNYVPAYRSENRSKLNHLINELLPEDCKIQTRSDFYYFNCIACACTMLFFPPMLVAFFYCYIKARRFEKEEKGGTL